MTFLSQLSLIHKSFRMAAAIGAVTLLSGCVVHVGHHDYGPQKHSRHSLSLDSEGLEQLSIESGNGDIDIVGVSGLSRIEVDGDIYAWDEQGRGVKFTLDKSGNEAVLVGKQKSYKFGSRGRIDMKIRVPAHLLLNIDDGSGAIEITDVKNDVFIDDGSGAIVLKDIIGNVVIKDGSGSIDANYVEGNLDIDDNSGSIHVSNIQGQVQIEDGSGVIEVSDVDNRVSINDGSGSIIVTRVAELNIIEAGSGGIDVSEVDHYSR